MQFIFGILKRLNTSFSIVLILLILLFPEVYTFLTTGDSLLNGNRTMELSKLYDYEKTLALFSTFGIAWITYFFFTSLTSWLPNNWFYWRETQEIKIPFFKNLTYLILGIILLMHTYFLDYYPEVYNTSRLYLALCGTAGTIFLFIPLFTRSIFRHEERNKNLIENRTKSTRFD